MNKIIIILSALLFVVSCESQEATYEEFAGDGKIRYVGKVNDLSIESGWKRFVLDWKESNDPLIDKYLVVWSSDGVRDSVIIDGTFTNFDTSRDIADGYEFTSASYIFEMYAMDANNNKSKVSMLVGTTINDSHPSVQYLAGIEGKAIFLDNEEGGTDATIILRDRDLKEEYAKIRYVDNTGADSEYELSTADYERGYVTLNIQRGLSQLYVDRHIRLEECIDLVKIEDDIAQTIVNIPFAVDESLMQEIMRSHGVSNSQFNDFCDSVTVLKLDYSLVSMADIVTFPKLERLILGSGRIRSSMLNYVDMDNSEKSSLFDKSIDIKAIKMIKSEINDKFKVQIYNDHYSMGASLTEVENLLDGNYTDNAPIPAGIEFAETRYTSDMDSESFNPSYTRLSFGSYTYYDNAFKLFDYFPDLSAQNVVREYAISLGETETEATVEINVSYSPYTYTANGMAIRHIYRDDIDNVDLENKPSTCSISYRASTSSPVVSIKSDVVLGNGRGEMTIIYFDQPINFEYLHLTLPLNEGKVTIDDVLFF